MKKLSSKKYSAGSRDYWWYNLSSPEKWINKDPCITFIVNGKDEVDKIGSITLALGENDWRARIMKASDHTHNQRKIIKVHLFKEKGSQQYKIYFGVKDDMGFIQ